MTRDECVKRSRQWLAIAEARYEPISKMQLGNAADAAALPALAATIAGVWATLAVSAERDGAENVVG